MRGMINLLGPLYVRVFRRGASEVKGTVKLTAAPSTTKVTLLTPTSGKKVRIVSCALFSVSATAASFELYFGTGTNILTTIANVIHYAALDVVDEPNSVMVWPDGGGPVGAVDAVVSMRATPDITTSGRFVIHYREE